MHWLDQHVMTFFYDPWHWLQPHLCILTEARQHTGGFYSNPVGNSGNWWLLQMMHSDLPGLAVSCPAGLKHMVLLLFIWACHAELQQAYSSLTWLGEQLRDRAEACSMSEPDHNLAPMYLFSPVLPAC